MEYQELERRIAPFLVGGVLLPDQKEAAPVRAAIFQFQAREFPSRRAAGEFDACVRLIRVLAPRLDDKTKRAWLRWIKKD